MDFPKIQRPRRIFKLLHTWIGLVAGLVIAVISMTGGIAVFRDEIELAISPHRATGSGVASLDELSRQISLWRPDAQVKRVRFPENAGDPYVVQLEAGGMEQRLVCEASTGRPAGTLNTEAIDWVIDLHRNLLMGRTGRKTVGIVGIVLFTLAGTGVLLWLMGARQWRSWVTVRSEGGSRKFYFELHRAVGLWSSTLLLVVAFVGVGLAFPDTLRTAIQLVTRSGAPVKAPRVNTASKTSRAPLGAFLSAASLALPDGIPTELRMPENKKSPVDLRFRRPGDISSSGNHVYLDPATAQVMTVSRLADQALATRIFAAFSPIHYGEFGGIPVKVIWALLGATPSVLFITGLITWWRPKRRQPPVAAQEDLALARHGG